MILTSHSFSLNPTPSQISATNLSTQNQKQKHWQHFLLYIFYFHFYISRKRLFPLPVMTEVLHFPSSSSTTNSSSPPPPSSPSSLSCAPHSTVLLPNGNDNGDDNEGSVVADCDPKERERDQLSVLALLIAIFRKSLVACKSDRRELCAMEISWPSNVRHVAHVTFDRFNGFLGLPVEFEPEVPRRAPSARYIVFFWFS